jgi:hypothetical protein
MSGKAMFLAYILEGHGNRDDEDNFSASDAGSFDGNDAEQFSTVLIKSAEDESHSDHSSDPPRMFVSPSLRLHPVLPTFRLKYQCKIHLHRPSSPPLQIIRMSTPQPPETNPLPSHVENPLPMTKGKQGGLLLVRHRRLYWLRLHPCGTNVQQIHSAARRSHME